MQRERAAADRYRGGAPALTGSDLTRRDSLETLLEHVQERSAWTSVALVVEIGTETGSGVLVSWGRLDVAPALDFRAGDEHPMVDHGPELFAEDQRLLAPFAAAAAPHEEPTPGEQRREARQLADRPAAHRAARRRRPRPAHPAGRDQGRVSAACADRLDWSTAERERAAGHDRGIDRPLDDLVANLLDASRLQAGALAVRAEPIALDEVVAAALLDLPDAATASRSTSPRPAAVMADPACWSGCGEPRRQRGAVRRRARTRADQRARRGRGASSQVIDHGPGVPASSGSRCSRRSSASATAARGRRRARALAVARGFAEAMGGALAADDARRRPDHARSAPAAAARR